MKNELTFRYAERKDTGLILQFIKELADYEKLLHEVVADEATLEEWIFDKQKAEVIFGVLDGKEIELCKKYSFAVAASYVFYVLKK